MKVTIKDIAKECGVSVTAVSMALSDKPNRISKKTREVVLETAKRLNYQPNQAAVSLATKKSRKIGVIFNDLTNPHIAELFMALSRVIQKKGYLLLCYVLSDEIEEDAVTCLQRMVSNDIAGLIWGKPLEENVQQELKNFIEKLDIPVMVMGKSNLTCPGMDMIYDYEQAAYMATQHLLELGHRRIGCVAGSKNFCVTKQRLDGYKRALEEMGISYNEELIYQGNYTMKSGRKSLAYLLGKKVTAIFAMNDEMAFGIYESARIYGVKIPEDLSVVGCDNVPFGNSLEVPLTTLCALAEEIGTNIGERIIEIIENIEKKSTKEPRGVEFYKPTLLVKGSTARIK